MKLLNYISSIFILLFTINSLVSCHENLKSNEFNIYVSEYNPGWHFVDLIYDSIHSGYHKINVRFEQGQKFQPAFIRSDLRNYQPTFLFNNGDTVKNGPWFKGEYNYDSLNKKFLCFYMPTQRQRMKTINSIYDSLRYEMDTIVENYLSKQNNLK